MGVISDKVQRGFATAVSPLASELLASDSRPVAPALLDTGNYHPPSRPVPLSRYFDPHFAKLEMEKVWKKCWQFACREEDLPEVGDRMPYDVGDLSYIIVRSAPDRLQAFNNTCLHRGTRLCQEATSSETLRCPYHAWQWNLDGTLRSVPSRWDFPMVTDDTFRLPEIKLETWGGFVFINPDRTAAPLAESLGVLPEHFKSFTPERRFTFVHVRKKMRANWKVVLEAFLESYHVIETHPEVVSFNGDASTQYDIWEDGKAHISRLLTPSAVPSPHLGEDANPRDAAVDALKAFAIAAGMDAPAVDPNAPLGRAEVAEWRRKTMGGMLGHDFSKVCDAEMIDSIEYFMFPHFCPWFGEGLPIVYQFLPLGSDPNEAVVSIRLTAPIPDSGPRPPAAPVIDLGYDTPFESVPQLGILGRVFDQDSSNMPLVQQGAKSAAEDRAVATLGVYQEARIRHFYDVLDRVVGI